MCSVSSQYYCYLLQFKKEYLANWLLFQADFQVFSVDAAQLRSIASCSHLPQLYRFYASDTNTTQLTFCLPWCSERDVIVSLRELCSRMRKHVMNWWKKLAATLCIDLRMDRNTTKPIDLELARCLSDADVTDQCEILFEMNPWYMPSPALRFMTRSS